MEASRNIAVFGGTFDPPTLAHEAIIQACIDRTDIDEVWVMPSGERMDKPGMQSDEARLAILGIVKAQSFNNNEKLVITDFEQQLPRPTQTYRTVAALKQAFPDNRFWFVYGSDSYHSMPAWQDGEELRDNLNMLLVERVGFDLPVETPKVRHLHVPREIIDRAVSSTKVREAVVNGIEIDDFVSPAVANWVQKNLLYTAV